MTRLPVIVGFGGYNAAGRSSFHQAYRRTVINTIDDAKRTETLTGLACMMKLVKHQDGKYRTEDGELLNADQVATRFKDTIEQNTLIRKIQKDYFDVDQQSFEQNIEMNSDQPSEFVVKRRQLPQPLPENWQTEVIDDKTVRVTVNGGLTAKIKSSRTLEFQSAAQLPTGFDPAEVYNSRFHPKGLQLAITGASDAINSMGISWDDVLQKVSPDEIAVYAASGLGQTDEYGIGGYLKARLDSNRPTSKQMALGLNSMPADFINAYVCGSVGTTSANAGACATFLYNLRLAVDDIKAGRHRVVICGSSEAPVNSEVIEAFGAMSALASNDKLAKLDDSENIDFFRASRPFGENCGFVIGESSQYFVLMDDELALELGAEIYGSVPDVFVNADGFKKSISSPGAGNYITLSKCVASAKAILGDEIIKHKSFIQAHGSSTPQNRVTESLIFDKVAKGFGIDDWPVTAVKAFVGHPLGPASGDQLASTLGVFADGILPGIKTVDEIASDVVDDRLDIVLQDKEAELDVAFLNSKGFGGNNATATVLSPNVSEQMLVNRYGESKMQEYRISRKEVRLKAEQYRQSVMNGDYQIIYNFGAGIIDEENISITEEAIDSPDFLNKISLNFDNPYSDMT